MNKSITMPPMHRQLRQYREDHGITQAHISSKTGKSRQRICALEAGDIRLTADEFVEICIIGLGISPGIFFTDIIPETGISNCTFSFQGT